MFSFRRCYCIKDPHGYFYLDGTGIPVCILSVAAAWHLFGKLKIFAGSEWELNKQIIAAGLPKHAKDDLVTVDTDVREMKAFIALAKRKELLRGQGDDEVVN